jgi:hypothetical protein
LFLLFYENHVLSIDSYKILKNIQAPLNITFRLFTTFFQPNRKMRSIFRAGKMCRSNGVGMEHKPNGLPLLGAPVALLITRDKAEPPTGGEA